MIARFFTAFCLVVAGSAIGRAAPLTIDTTASKIDFVAKATGHSFEGTVKKWTLEVNVPDGADAPDSAVFKADVATFTTDHEKRDSEMFTWIENEKFPQLVFTLGSLTKSDVGGYTASGEMEFHGIKKPFTMPVSIMREGNRMTIRGDAVVNYEDFGLPLIRKFAMLTVRPEVAVSFEMVGTL